MSAYDAWSVRVLCLLHACCLHGVLFDPEDGWSMYLSNGTKLLPNYTESHAKFSTLHNHICENLRSKKRQLFYGSRKIIMIKLTASSNLHVSSMSDTCWWYVVLTTLPSMVLKSLSSNLRVSSISCTSDGGTLFSLHYLPWYWSLMLRKMTKFDLQCNTVSKIPPQLTFLLGILGSKMALNSLLLFLFLSFIFYELS
jgi:hypothetical protein